ncbi:bacillithiol system redox-active protein YtxJ [Mesonia aestuariivivens]|uniref:Bacillithiol system redox-active protein YtxJ n=1 Tax=Mesonia aestuariivivens TaxID=2796128 RepID=A0ABS6W0I8_9FLAO|nr:bacillithiol system redox-active protein YtxJ [Mesonia aestuariivivens]MBW2961366.1 bacillithiol system redox-active protein YtxJ [Mesonia aestuariivivens]
MGILDKIFKGNNETKSTEKRSQTPWNELKTELEIQQVKEESKEKVIVIFKHSTRCGISKMAKRQFESEYNYSEEQVKLYYLDLIANREVSTKVAEVFGVFHESPQMIVIKDGNVVYHTSHNHISAEKIGEFVS